MLRYVWSVMEERTMVVDVDITDEWLSCLLFHSLGSLHGGGLGQSGRSVTGRSIAGMSVKSMRTVRSVATVKDKKGRRTINTLNTDRTILQERLKDLTIRNQRGRFVVHAVLLVPTSSPSESVKKLPPSWEQRNYVSQNLPCILLSSLFSYLYMCKERTCTMNMFQQCRGVYSVVSFDCTPIWVVALCI